MKRKVWFVGAILSTLAAGTLSAVAGCDPRVFLDALRISLPFTPKAVAVGDFNGDGFADIAAASDSSFTSLQIMLGNGDGTFGAPIEGGNFYGGGLLAADLNGDGKADLVMSPYSVAVLLSNGDGTFQTPVALPSQAFQVPVLADLTKTGKIDIVTLEVDTVVIFPGNGDGTFGDSIRVDLDLRPTTTAGAIAAGDVDGDGIPDIVAVSEADLIVLKGRGNRTFDPPYRVTVGLGLSSVAIGDLDGDGLPDLGVTLSNFAEVQGSTIGFLHGRGDGNFDAALETFAGSGATDLVLADADGDGSLDAFATTGAGVTLFRGNGTGRFSPPVGYPGGAQFAIGDFNGDGQLDVAAPVKDGVSILLGNGRAMLRGPEVFQLPFSSLSVAHGDFDGDGREDLLIGGRDDSVVGLLRGNGDGTFATPSVVYGQAFDPVVVSGDFDRDGKLDAAIEAGYPEPSTTILLGNGDGSLRELVSYPGLGVGPVADVNNDGKLDIVSVESQGAVVVALGNGDGTFQPPISTPLATFTFFIKLGDVDGDGKLDAVVLESPQSLGATPVEVLLGHGDGSFESKYSYPALEGASDIAIADVTGDGKPDLLIATANNGLLLFAGHGDGTFEDPVVFDAMHRVQSVVCADFDGDGILDVVSTNFDPAEVVFFRGLGSGGYEAPVPFASGFADRALAVASFAGAAPDLLLQFGDSAFALLRNGRSTASVGPRNVVVGHTALLKASASGTGPLTYQWRREGTPLVDGGRVSGVNEAELRVEGVQFSDAGSYDVVVTDSCGTAESNAAPLSVEFADVAPADPFHAAILKVARAGITGGCGSGNFCPESATTRGEMAVFLLRGEHGGAYQPPSATGTVFGDVGLDTPFAKWIERVAAEGITQGCGEGNYCPAGLVARDQMAVFLLRAKHGGSYQPPAATGTVFSDVPADAPFAKWIERLAAEAISSGCGGGKYCPGAIVTRAQMAAFLVRTFGL